MALAHGPIEDIRGPSAPQPAVAMLSRTWLPPPDRRSRRFADLLEAPPRAGSFRPCRLRGFDDGDRDRTWKEGSSRLRLRRHRDRSFAAHPRPRRHRHLLEARPLPVRAADDGLRDGRRRLARDGRHRRPPRRPRRAQPRGHLHPLRGRRGAARADRRAAQGARHARDAGDLPRAGQARADRPADPGDQGAESRRRGLADAAARAAATTRSRSRPGSTCS